MPSLWFCLVLFCLIGLCDVSFRAQEPAAPSAATGQTSTSSWHREEKSDPLRKLDYSQFVLEGKYLIPPRAKTPGPPMLVARCEAGSNHYGHAHGKFLAGYLSIDGVLDFHSGGVPVSLRLDEGKVQSANWTQSTDGSGAFFQFVEFDNLLYGHLLPTRTTSSILRYLRYRATAKD
jgi:hypothetical protein